MILPYLVKLKSEFDEKCCNKQLDCRKWKFNEVVPKTTQWQTANKSNKNWKPSTSSGWKIRFVGFI